MSLFATWQDGILAFVSIAFAVALVPAILSKRDKPPFFTSVMTCALLLLTSATEASLSLWFGAVSAFVTAACWFILATQMANYITTEGG